MSLLCFVNAACVRVFVINTVSLIQFNLLISRSHELKHHYCLEHLNEIKICSVKRYGQIVQ